MISWNSDHSSLLPIPKKTQLPFTWERHVERACPAVSPARLSPPMLTFLVSWQTCTSMFLLSRLALFLQFPGRVTSKSACGG